MHWVTSESSEYTRSSHDWRWAGSAPLIMVEPDSVIETKAGTNTCRGVSANAARHGALRRSPFRTSWPTNALKREVHSASGTVIRRTPGRLLYRWFSHVFNQGG